ncbi:hypothetical protein LCGC14_0893510 [marine sediment metagenome]|uniref:Uncharacterized protein n=1 Tax=marine sediment metagenome TaxID=412755 RepID=A0A0F9PJ76_9ZZZZ
MAKKRKGIEKYNVHFALYGTIEVTARNKATAENKAHRMSIKELIRKAKSIDKESLNQWEADRID